MHFTLRRLINHLDKVFLLQEETSHSFKLFKSNLCVCVCVCVCVRVCVRVRVRACACVSVWSRFSLWENATGGVWPACYVTGLQQPADYLTVLCREGPSGRWHHWWHHFYLSHWDTWRNGWKHRASVQLCFYSLVELLHRLLSARHMTSWAEIWLVLINDHNVTWWTETVETDWGVDDDRSQVSEDTQMNRPEQEETGDCGAVRPGGGAKGRTAGGVLCVTPRRAVNHQPHRLSSS